VSPTKGKAAAVKDLGPMPKGVSSAYLHFIGEYIPKLRKDDAITPQKELMKLAGAKWGEMSDKDKQPYEAMKEKDAKRLEKQIAEREKKGYFTFEDGTKSTDPANKDRVRHEKKEKKEKGDKKAAESEEEEELVRKPKRGLSSYMYFSNEFIKKLRENKSDTETN